MRLDSIGNTSTKQANLASKPLTEKTRKATFEVLHYSHPEQTTAVNSQSKHLNDLTNTTFVQMEATGYIAMVLDCYKCLNPEMQSGFLDPYQKQLLLQLAVVTTTVCNTCTPGFSILP
ncbi:hypothetical protein L1987_15295 [Smallanthus sonchifolius]|uniref:Uncharacterized protein n=1 Tax=Smallanthus sonchifolius TaxID=185202 RepID=A0ACB9J581_9ASTR|nr:hypothetical protein L1987_15295 [Smallanthus sonchifolius]